MKQLFNYKFNEINDIYKQSNFFKNEVSESDQKVVVIISDALRYECGVELLKAMMLDTKGNAKIKHMMAGIPTVTHWGMANLLTDEKITLDEDKLRVEGILTDGTDNREKNLKN